MHTLTLRSRRVIADAPPRPASIHIRDGRIERIGAYDDGAEGVTDYGDLVLMSGVVDSHVHVNEPGRTEWEGFVTATRAAAAGGVTTIVDMPLNSIPATTSVEALRTKVAAMDGKCFVDVGLWGGAVPGNAAQLQPMLDAGALGFKCFLVESGVPEFGHLDSRGLEQALHALRGTGAPLLVHAELPEPIEASRPKAGDDPRAYANYLRSRPHQAEDQAIELVYRSCRATGAAAHIVHLSSADGIATIDLARREGVPLTAETTPHYLYFSAETIPDAAPQFKCAPPIRDENNRERLWKALRSGAIAAIVSDHSPCTPELKHLTDGDVEHAWGGIASLQFGLPIVWTEARRRGFALEEIAALMSGGPAAVARVSDRKGHLAAGYDADIIAFDPDASFRVTEDLVQHRHKVTPYLGHELYGVVHATYLRGQRISGHGTPAGTWIRR